jgi:hypothetical protein
MPATYTNQTSHLVILQLNNGNSVYLAPGQRSSAIPDHEVSGNDKIAKLVRNNFLNVGEPAKSSSEEAEEEEAPKKPRKKKSDS